MEEQYKNLAYFCGLLRDIGRFSPLMKYNTFDDGKSLDHAYLSVKIINESGILKNLDKELQQVMFDIIQFHNKMVLQVVMALGALLPGYRGCFLLGNFSRGQRYISSTCIFNK